jgi:hypothetical protein
MASITPRASGFWAESVNRTSYFPDYASVDDEDAEQQDEEYEAMMEDDYRTPLDKTIDRIGMGMQYDLFVLHPLNNMNIRELSMDIVVIMWFW